jgi:hypothetical protein
VVKTTVVQKEEIWSPNQARGDVHAANHPSRELRDLAAGGVRQVDRVEQRLRPCTRVSSREAEQPAEQHQVLEHGELGVE